MAEPYAELSPRLTVASTTELQAVPTGALLDGMFAYVTAGSGSHWFLKKSSSTTVSAGVVYSADSNGGVGAGRWFLSTAADGLTSEQTVTTNTAAIQDGRDVLVLVIRTSGTDTGLTLSDTALIGDYVTVKLDPSSTATIVTVNQSTGFTIDGAATFVFSDLGESYTFRKSTVGWKAV